MLSGSEEWLHKRGAAFPVARMVGPGTVPVLYSEFETTKKEILMKVHAIHDARGNIVRVIVSPPNAPPGTPAAPAGHSITEVETDLEIDPTNPANLSRLQELIKSFRVDVKTSAKLVRKTGPAGS